MTSRFVNLMITILGCPVVCSAQLRVPIQSFSSSGTTLDAATNSSQRLFSAMGQPVAMKDTDPAATQAGILQLANYIVVVLDEEPPLINYTPNPVLQIGNLPDIQLQIEDYNPIPHAMIHYRPIAGDVFQTADLLRKTVGEYSFQVESSMHDAMGMEYYFTAEDAAPVPNASRSPAEGSYYAYATNPSVAVPITSFGDQLTNYRIVSVPYSPANNTVVALFDELGEYKNTRWRMATYVNASDTFIEYPGEFTTLERGRGYWMIVKNTTEIAIGPVDAPRENRANLYALTLKPGWNMIGNPYPVVIGWDDVQTLNDDPGIGQLHVYNGGWDNTSNLAAFQGGFINYTGTSERSVKIPFKGQTMEGGRVGDRDERSVWSATLEVYQQGTYSKLGGFGMHPDARIGDDMFDDFNPPRFIDSPEISFSDGKCKEMVPAADEYVWDFEASGAAGQPTTLEWNVKGDTQERDLYLFDKETLAVINMETEHGYSFASGATAKSFKVYYGTDVLKNIFSDGISFGTIYPNPMSAGDRARLRMALPRQDQSYSISFELNSANGKKMISADLIASPGVSEMELPDVSQLSNGIYFYRIVVAGDSRVVNGKLLVL